MSDGRLTRRRLLATAGAGLASGLAGCGYQPAGGELDWTGSVDSSGTGFRLSTSDERWLSDGTRLFGVRNRSGRTFAPSFDDDTGRSGFVEVDDARVTAYTAAGDVDWSGGPDAQYVGTPAAVDGRVYAHLENETVVALERAETDDEGGPNRGSSTADATTRWTADWDGPPLSLDAGPALIVGSHRDGLVGFDAADGDERFALEDESLAGDSLANVTVGTDRVWTIGDDGGNPTLFGIGTGGDVRATVSLPSTPCWLASVGSRALVGVDDEVRAVTGDGDREFSVSLEGGTDGGTPTIVSDRERLYHYSSGTLEAVDVDRGERVWSRDDHSFRGSPVADGDGVYGQGSTDGMDGCGLVGVTADGEPWWHVPPLEDLGCRGDRFLVDDRLVIVDGNDLYGFRTQPGTRYTLL